MAGSANHNVEEHRRCWCGPFYSESLQRWIHFDELVPIGRVLVLPHLNIVVINEESIEERRVTYGKA